ncbi:VRR-NUC domain-containing protein [Aliivibrio fischeri]|uniref:VRR-NUC domain-containing protein n=1 Tax=Aliivibrio fischeri TaxID=668 RepID=UPI001F1BBA0D|nr:VRR-NUC domain-containing protein [Aliivibrio fischeri]
MMIYTIQEKVITYPEQVLKEWQKGNKDWLPIDLTELVDCKSYFNKYFHECYALTHYLDNGWYGTAFYALGDSATSNSLYDAGRVLLSQYICPVKLSLLKGIRTGLTAGEPELFLFKPDGSLLFVKVQKVGKHLSEAELICLSNIKSVLECEVEIVYVMEGSKTYKPKTYDIKVVQFPNPLGV